MRRYLWVHVPVGLSYFGFLLVKHLWGGGWVGRGLSFWVGEGWLLVGVLAGVWLLFLDRVVYVFAYPEEQLSQHFLYLWKKRRYGEALELLYVRRSEQVRLTMRSALFLMVWLVLGMFTVTSVPSLFGRGLVMGGWWHVLYDAWRLQRMAPERLKARLFWQVKKEVGREEQWLFLVGMSLVFGLLSLGV